MKKLFLLLTAIVLCSSMTWAQGSLAHFPYATAGVTISSGDGNKVAASGWADWDSSYSGTFLRVLATNTNASSYNYLQIYFKGISTQVYNNGSGGTFTGPAVGSYSTIGYSCDSYFSEWYDYNYSGVIKMGKTNSCGYCYFGAMIGYSADGSTRPSVTADNTKWLNAYTYSVEVGKGGTMYIAIRNNETNALEITIGEPKPSYSVSVSSNNTSLGTVNSAGNSYSEGNSSDIFTASATTGVFDGWYLDENKVSSSTSNYTISNEGSSIQLLNLQSDHVLEARFNAPSGSYAVNYGVSPTGAGSIISATYGDAPGTSFDNGDELEGGTSVTLTAGNNSGYRFDKWSNNATANPYTFLLSKDTTLTAQFIKTYVITATSSVGGSATGSGTYDVNAQATLIATSTDEHLYFFDHWLKGEDTYAGGATINPTVTADATYTAVFRPASIGTITANVSPAASGSVTVNQPSTAGGTAVTLTAAANDGYTFTGWDDDNDGTIDNTAPTRTVYVDGTKEYTAKFVEGVTIDVQAAMTENHGWGWGDCFYYWAKAYGYDIMIRGADNLVYTANEDFGISEINTSESYINDHGTTVRFTAFDARFYNQGGKKVLEANAVGNNGKNYHLILRGVGIDSDDTAQNYNQTFTSGQVEIRPGNDNVTDIKWFRGQNGSGESYTTTWCSHLFFKLDQTQCGTIPSGIYPINDTQQAGTVVSTFGSNNQSYGSYFVQSYLYYVPVTGWVEVVNRDEQYYVYADAYNSRGYDYKTTYGTAPYTVTVSGDANGTAGIVWHSNNCGDVVYGAGTQKFFSGNSITLTATPNSGYEFWRWSDEDASVKTSAYGASRNVTVSGNLTLQAIFRVAGPVSPNITLCENCNDAHYNTFKATYGGSAGVGVNVTYPRQFTASRWSTMCLPFSLDLATMIANKMYGCVYEFKYATGNANVGSGVNLYFSNAKSIEAGKCYIVNANDALAEKTSFVFSGVTIDLSKDNGVALTSVGAYNNLPSYKSEGTIELVGTLRNGTLKGSATGNTYMGLKNNKIYYPNTDTGSTIWAYRGIFRSSEILDKESMQKMRIIVDGEDRGELIIDADGDILAPSDAQSRKFIRDGVLYIEREGVVYDAQGKRVEGM
ncbi:MAG: InlB B-repeat-containing protein [Paludibacteraceae bacterium]|nr:InlB B-repeat-containing protein [Paludibacteraceae bacterium]